MLQEDSTNIPTAARISRNGARANRIVGRYRNLKLGKPDDEPDFSRPQWFAMLFCCGVAVGLFYYGVAEPVWHYHGYGGPRWSDGYGGFTDNDRAAHALMVTYFHWGLHGWVPRSDGAEISARPVRTVFARRIAAPPRGATWIFRGHPTKIDGL